MTIINKTTDVKDSTILIFYRNALAEMDVDATDLILLFHFNLLFSFTNTAKIKDPETGEMWIWLKFSYFFHSWPFVKLTVKSLVSRLKKLEIKGLIKYKWFNIKGGYSCIQKGVNFDKIREKVKDSTPASSQFNAEETSAYAEETSGQKKRSKEDSILKNTIADSKESEKQKIIPTEIHNILSRAFQLGGFSHKLPPAETPFPASQFKGIQRVIDILLEIKNGSFCVPRQFDEKWSKQFSIRPLSPKGCKTWTQLWDHYLEPSLQNFAKAKLPEYEFEDKKGHATDFQGWLFNRNTRKSQFLKWFYNEPRQGISTFTQLHKGKLPEDVTAIFQDHFPEVFEYNAAPTETQRHNYWASATRLYSWYKAEREDLCTYNAAYNGNAFISYFDTFPGFITQLFDFIREKGGWKKLSENYLIFKYGSPLWIQFSDWVEERTGAALFMVKEKLRKMEKVLKEKSTMSAEKKVTDKASDIFARWATAADEEGGKLELTDEVWNRAMETAKKELAEEEEDRIEKIKSKRRGAEK